jgi:hypothetical protein
MDIYGLALQGLVLVNGRLMFSSHQKSSFVEAYDAV